MTTLDKARITGEEKLTNLLKIVNQCMIRRTHDILSKYLPPKVEMVVSIPLLASQLSMYKDFVARKADEATEEKGKVILYDSGHLF